jgi:VWFA-related protein
VRAPRFLGLVFDDLTLTADDLVPVRTAAKRFLTHGLQSTDLVGIFFTSKGLVQSFTADSAKLSEAVDHLNLARTHIDLPSCPNLTAWEVMEIAGMLDSSLLTLKTNEARSCGFCADLGRGRGGGGGSAAGGSGRAGIVNGCALRVEMLARSLWEQIRESSARTLYALQAIVDYMAEMPGRRAIVLASSGFLSRTLEEEREIIIDRALRAAVVINSLDAKGLYTQDLSLEGPVPAMATLQYRQNLGTRTQWESDDAMAILASSTGGLFFHNNNDIDLGFRELGLVPEVSYILGFSPISAPDGKYHKLKIRLKTPGQHEVQARPGYYATIPPSVPPAAERRIDKEVLSLSTVDDVASRVAAVSFETPGGETALRVTLHLDVQRLRFTTVAGVRMLKLTFIAVLFDEHSAFVAGKEGQAEFMLKEETFNRLTSGLDTKLTLVAPPGKYRLRSVVSEGTEGKLTAASQEVEIR